MLLSTQHNPQFQSIIQHFITVLIVNTSIQKQMYTSWNWNIWGHQLWYRSGIKVNTLWKCLGSVILPTINVSLQTFCVYFHHMELIQWKNFTNFAKGYPFNKSCLDVIVYRQILDQVCFWPLSNLVILFNPLTSGSAFSDNSYCSLIFIV